jgi:hypothetical protein
MVGHYDSRRREGHTVTLKIKAIAKISKGGEFYTMLADKALNQNNDTAP